MLAQSSQRQSPFPQGLQSCTLQQGHPQLLWQQGCSQPFLQMACSGLWDCSIPGTFAGQRSLPWALIPPAFWLVADLHLFRHSDQLLPYAQGTRCGLAFSFILVACLQPSPEQTPGFSGAGASFPHSGLTLPCPAGSQQQPGEQVLPHCSSLLPFWSADPSESGGCIFARVNKSQWYSLQICFPLASNTCAAFSPTEKQTVS